MGSSGRAAAAPGATPQSVSDLTAAQNVLAARLTTAEAAQAAAATQLGAATAGQSAADGEIATLKARLAAVEALLAARTQGVGTFNAGLLSMGGVWSVPIVFAKPMPDNTYAVISVEIEAAAGMSGALVPVLPVVNPTATGCTVGVRNAGPIALAAAGKVRVTVAKL